MKNTTGREKQRLFSWEREELKPKPFISRAIETRRDEDPGNVIVEIEIVPHGDSP